MGTKDRRVDAYIANSAPFAKPILKHIRSLIHKGCPEVNETIKWGLPHFEHKGILCFMGSFKAHCAFGFWKGALLKKDHPAIGARDEKAMGQFGRISGVRELPSDKAMLALVKSAVKLNEAGAKSPTRSREATRKPVIVPPYILTAIRKNKKALATFEKFSPSHKREYITWITGAKQEATRLRRLAQAVEMLAEGKSQNWKYEQR